MPATFVNRYQKTIKGNMVQVGNTLGLSKANNTLTPGTLGSIGAFITTDSTKQAPGGWPFNTTLNFNENSSSAILTIPTGAVVDYAELVWSAAYVVTGSDVTASINNSITFRDPRGITTPISATGVNIINISLTESTETSTSYVKSADVTSIVSAAGSGTYICGAVPAALSATSNFSSYAGWTLYVIYRLSQDPVRNIILFVGQTVSLDVPYSVPINYPGPPFQIRICYSAGEGDAIITADMFNTRPATGVNQVMIGTASQPAATNPFASIIGDQNGGIDTTGSFGTFNQSGTSATNIVGGRQGWDIANNVNITSAFTGGAVASLGLDIGSNNDPAILNTNGFIVDLSQPIATITKSVDKTTAKAGDTLQYTLVYRFTTVPMTTANTTIMDTIPNGLTYKTGSVILNGTPQPSFDIRPPGINLGTVSTVSTFTVIFNATVNNTIQTTSIPNDAFGSYQFVSGGTPFVNENTSNSVLTIIDPFNATATKATNRSYADIGDVIIYTITIPNNGATLGNVVFKDTIPNGTTYLTNSFTVNGVTLPGENPNLGVNLNTIPINSFTTITFQVLVNTIPNPNPIVNNASVSAKYNFLSTIPNGDNAGLNTNSVNTIVNSAVVSTYKVVDRQYANIGDILTYTIPITNSGNTTANNIVFSDTIPNDTTLVSGSFTQNGIAIAGTPNPPGVAINNLAAGAKATIVFKVKINTIPNPNPIPNIASIFFTYTVDPTTISSRVISNGRSTNTVNTRVNNANLSGAVKYVDKEYANCGDTINYTIVVPNTGNITAENIVFKDTIPNGTSLILNSFKVNGSTISNANLNAGVTIQNIPAGSISTLTFSVVVNC